MKSNCKRLFRVLFLMLAIPFFSDCEKDDFQDEQVYEENPFKTFSDFPELAGLYEKAVTNKISGIKTKTNGYNSLYDFYIDPSKVRKITTDIGDDYTMRIYRKTPLPDHAFENLVITTKKGQEPEAVLVKYLPDDFYIESWWQGTDVPFSGERYAIPVDLNKIQNKALVVCVTIDVPGDCTRPMESACDGYTYKNCITIGGYQHPGPKGNEGGSTGGGSNGSSSTTNQQGGGGTSVVTTPINVNPAELINMLGFHPRSKEAEWMTNFENNAEVGHVRFFLDDNKLPHETNPHPDAIRVAKTVIEVLSGAKDHTALTNKRELKLFLSIVTNRLKRANEQHRGVFNEITGATSSIDLALDDKSINPDALSVEDLQFIAKQYNTMYAVAESNIYNKENIRIVSNSVASAALLPQVKSLVGDLWPKNAEEWAALGQVMAPILLEAGLSVIPGADIIDVVKGIADNDYVMVTIALAGLAVDLAGGTLIKVAAKFTKAAYKGFKVVRAVGDGLVSLGKVLKKDGFSTAYESGVLTLKKKRTTPGPGPDNQVIASGEEAVKAYVKTSSKLDDLGLDAALRNDPNVVKALQKVDCN